MRRDTLLSMDLRIEIARADRADAMALMTALDAYLEGLYPAASNHLLSVAELLKPEFTFLLATLDGHAVGCGALRNCGDYGEIKRMYVKPEQRGKRFGVLILSKLEELAAQKNLHVLRLETGVAQPESLRLYERRGYQRIGAFGPYADDPLSLFYEKKL